MGSKCAAVNSASHSLSFEFQVSEPYRAQNNMNCKKNTCSCSSALTPPEDSEKGGREMEVAILASAYLSGIFIGSCCKPSNNGPAALVTTVQQEFAREGPETTHVRMSHGGGQRGRAYSAMWPS